MTANFYYTPFVNYIQWVSSAPPMTPADRNTVTQGAALWLLACGKRCLQMICSMAPAARAKQKAITPGASPPAQ